MQKKIDVHDLVPGMYLAELDRPWRETPFPFQRFEIQTYDEIEWVKHNCKYVYIDVVLGDDVKSSPSTGSPNEGMGRVIVAEQRGDRLQILGNAPLVQHHDQTTFEEEIKTTQEIDLKARDMVSTMMEDARLGKTLDASGAKDVVTGLTESVLRNPDALVCWTHLRDKDNYTALHCLRVSILALAFGRHLGFEEEQLNIVGIGGLMGDVGMAKIPSDILNKPASLTAQEYEIVKNHVPYGVDTMRSTKGIPVEAIEVVQFHHEWYNGSGYMKGLKGDAIGLYGLMGGIIDWYDAVTSERPHRRAIAPTQALTRMYEQRNRIFHPTLVEKFIECMGIYPIGSVVEFHSQEVGVILTGDRAQRLRPKVAVVLNSEKKPYLSNTKFVELSGGSDDTAPKSLEIKRVLPAGAYGINPTEYLLPGDFSAR
ncbi:MAG: HD-GYP domain-containing protein [Gammaproteobacteria bacterium]